MVVWGLLCFSLWDSVGVSAHSEFCWSQVLGNHHLLGIIGRGEWVRCFWLKGHRYCWAYPLGIWLLLGHQCYCAASGKSARMLYRLKVAIKGMVCLWSDVTVQWQMNCSNVDSGYSIRTRYADVQQTGIRIKIASIEQEPDLDHVSN